MEKDLEVNLYLLKMHVNVAFDMKEYFLQLNSGMLSVYISRQIHNKE